MYLQSELFDPNETGNYLRTMFYMQQCHNVWNGIQMLISQTCI